MKAVTTILRMPSFLWTNKVWFTSCMLVVLCASAICAEEGKPEDSVVIELNSSMALLDLKSDPVGASFTINDVDLPDSLPNFASIDSGSYTIEAFLEGYEPLSYSFSCLRGEELLINFIMMPAAPEPQEPESIGLAYRPLSLSIDSSLADRQMKKYRSAAEFFAIFPLGQGLLAKLFLGNERSDEANVMIASGVALTAGSLLVGKLFSSHKRSSIREDNKGIVAENTSATLHNKDVQQTLRESDRKQVAQWKATNLLRGRVSVERR